MQDRVKTLILGLALLFTGILFALAALDQYVILSRTLVMVLRVLAAIFCVVAGVIITKDSFTQKPQ